MGDLVQGTVVLLCFVQLSGSQENCRMPSCVNGHGVWVREGASLQQTCVCKCKDGYAGEHCSLEDKCKLDKNPCDHGGKCVTLINGEFYCDCVPGYLAPFCEDRDPCVNATAANHCLNGATCRRMDDFDFRCECPVPYEGDHCETINLCRLDIGECLDTSLNDWDSLCFPCSRNILPRPHGCTLLGGDEYQCNCLRGWSGSRCDEVSNTSLTFLSKLSLPILDLHEMEPDSFIVHRVIMPNDGVVVLAINVSSDFLIHVSLRRSFRPTCEDVMEQWNTSLPVYPDENDLVTGTKFHRLLGFFQNDEEMLTTSKSRGQGQQSQEIKVEGPRQEAKMKSRFFNSFGPIPPTPTSKSQKPKLLMDYYLVLWPESRIFGSRKMTEVTMEMGVYKLNCILEQVLESGGRMVKPKPDEEVDPSDRYVAVRDDPCYAEKLDSTKARIVVCECYTLPFTTIRSFLEPMEFHTETYTPVDLNLDITPSPIIPWVVLGVSIIYLILFILLLFLDCRNAKRPKLIVMTYIDAILDETFYLLTIETGNHLLAACSASICCEIYGSCCRTKPMILSEKSLQTTRQDDEDNFLFSTPESLGDLEKVRIWHDNSGPTPDWYLRKVVIKELKSDKTWYFLFNRWLTVNDSTLICSAVALTPEETERFLRGTFWKTFKHEIRERHMFLGPFLCPPHSKYRRSERITVFFTVIFIHMILLIIAYEIPKPFNEDPLAVTEWGEYNWVNNGVWYKGFIVTLIGVPIGAAIACLFRMTGRKHVPALLVCLKILEERRREMGPFIRQRRLTLAAFDKLSRWLNLDPNRIMVVGVPQPRREKPELTDDDYEDEEEEFEGDTWNANLHSKSENPDEFRIPSTSVSQTETWIARMMRNEKNKKKIKEPVQTLDEPKNKPPYKIVLNDGVVGAVVSMKDDLPNSLVYKSMSNVNQQKQRKNEKKAESEEEKEEKEKKKRQIDVLIAREIRTTFNDPLWKKKRARFSDSQEELFFSSKGGAETLGRKMRMRRRRELEMVDASTQTTFACDMVSRSVAGIAQLRRSGDPKMWGLKKCGLFRRPPAQKPDSSGVELCEIEYLQGMALPGCLRPFLWLLCLVIMIVAGILTAVYGKRYGLTRSLNWCFSLLWATFFLLVFTQAVILIIFTFCIHFGKQSKKGHSYDEVKSRERLQLLWFTNGCNFPPRWPLLYIFFLQRTYYAPLTSFIMFPEEQNSNSKDKDTVETSARAEEIVEDQS